MTRVFSQQQKLEFVRQIDALIDEHGYTMAKAAKAVCGVSSQAYTKWAKRLEAEGLYDRIQRSTIEQRSREKRLAEQRKAVAAIDASIDAGINMDLACRLQEISPRTYHEYVEALQR